MDRESGFTLVETLAAISVFAIASVGFYGLLFSGSRGADAVRSITSIASDARLGLNRMVRDTRQAKGVAGSPSPTSTAFTIDVDLDGDGQILNPNPQGDYETETFAYDATSKTLTITGGPNNAQPVGPYTLVAGVTPIGGGSIFSFSSNHLEYDWDANGVATLAELQAAPSHGFGMPRPIDFVSNVTFAFNVASGGKSTNFYGQAQLRNDR
jgi:prepilin-type N-terminal cleavage/methylation domain-containing protein